MKTSWYAFSNENKLKNINENLHFFDTKRILQQIEINITQIDGRSKRTTKLSTKSTCRHSWQILRTISTTNCSHKHNHQSIFERIYRSCKIGFEFCKRFFFQILNIKKKILFTKGFERFGLYHTREINSGVRVRL